MVKSHYFGRFVAIAILLSAGMFATFAYASHSWGGFHWARTANPFNLKLGDNASGAWDSHLAVASNDWSASSVLDTTVVPGGGTKNCWPTNGRVEVCNRKYGNNGWLGVATIWISGSHIVQGTVKLNDTYFNTSYYNKPAWRQAVMCQEVGHTFGLGHQDEISNNPNLGSCMDYTNDPDGTLYGQLDNQHPNSHDYEELEIIYQHLDSSSTVFSRNSSLPAAANEIDTSNPVEWGKVVRRSADGRSSLYERDLGDGNKVFTFVIWAN